MQTISVVTKLCGCYWACSVSRAAPTSLFGEGKGRSRRLGVQQRAQHALGCLDSARDLYSGAGWEQAPGEGRSFVFFFKFPALFV